MQIWPAIDLRGGKCVRLRQGDYQQETVFSDDPVAVARQFAAAGARHLHMVDLDGAREGSPVNLPVVQDIVASVEMACELGGGIRDEQSIEELLGFGVARLVIGTSAIKDPEWFREDAQQIMTYLAAGQIAPLIAARLPLTEAAEAHRLLESGKAQGKIVLLP